jgi:hypothetical protein
VKENVGAKFYFGTAATIVTVQSKTAPSTSYSNRIRLESAAVRGFNTIVRCDVTDVTLASIDSPKSTVAKMNSIDPDAITDPPPPKNLTPSESTAASEVEVAHKRKQAIVVYEGEEGWQPPRQPKFAETEETKADSDDEDDEASTVSCTDSESEEHGDLLAHYPSDTEVCRRGSTCSL